ncbi:MAG: TRAP transporter small permease subunit [Alphaproteobacteria bacterium]|nr:TRAP transporter small permease subunit [Alphaproteobacteria bacterium]
MTNDKTGPDLGDPILGLADAPDPPLSSYSVEDWVSFVFFWLLAFVVFLQFFSRYVLNDSIAWTEEIARYLLICVCFVGAATAMRKMSHIHVEFFYVYLPPAVGRILSTLVDILRIAFLAYGTYQGWKVTEIMELQRMVVIDLPMSLVFGTATLGFALMTVRAVQAAVRHWRTGESALTRVNTEGRHQ